MKSFHLTLAALTVTAGLAACTGGSETNAAVGEQPPRDAPTAAAAKLDARRKLAQINPAIPVYDGAQFRADLTSRDSVMVRSRYGNEAEVFTLATDDSFPQVYHYYMTYLAQFRAFPAQDTWPAEQKDWRTLEIPLHEAMQDPFVPGEALDPRGPRVLLQVAETEAEPRTVIRYVVMPPAAPGATPPVAAVSGPVTVTAAPATAPSGTPAATSAGEAVAR